MIRMSRLLVILLLAVGSSRSAVHADDFTVPEPLKRWTAWVAERDPGRGCVRHDEESWCGWPASLKLELGDGSGTFELTTVADREVSAPLPGGDGIWPLELSDERGKAFPILEASGRPVTRLTAGTHHLRGRFAWRGLPEKVAIPEEYAILELVIGGKRITEPRRHGGAIWLQGDRALESSDSHRIEIYRRISDGVPPRVTTVLTIKVAGRPREIPLGRVIPPNLELVSVSSDLGVRFSSTGDLTVQGAPGTHSITLESVVVGEGKEFSGTPHDDDAAWNSNEVWVWEPDEQLRSIVVHGGSPIDPSQTELPEAWRRFGAFVVAPGEHLSLEETRRGMPEPEPNNLTLRRDLWLDLDGAGFTIRDQISGTVAEGWRLSASGVDELGQVTERGEPRLVTKVDGQSGVEVRNASVDLVALWRRGRAGSGDRVPLGWSHDFQQVNATLHLPPGWSLFRASGVDSTFGAIVDSFSLLELFTILLLAIATARLFGRNLGVLAGLMGILGHGSANAPLWIWFQILAACALLMKLPEGGFKRVTRWFVIGCFLGLAVLSAGFAAEQLRIGFFPQLAEPSGPSAIIAEVLAVVFERSVIGWPLLYFSTVLVLFTFTRTKGFLGLLMKLGVTVGFFVMLLAGIGMFGALYVGSFGSNELSFAPQGSNTQQRYESQAAPEVAAVYNDDLVSGSGYAAKSVKTSRKKQAAVDPNAVVQTGPGAPQWSWRQWSLDWHGAVRSGTDFGLTLVGPRENLIACLLRVVLVVIVGAGLWRRASASVLALAVAFLVLPSAARAQESDAFPPESMLTELSRRIDENRCTEACVSASSVTLSFTGPNLVLRARLNSRGGTAWPLPHGGDQFVYGMVSVDGAAPAPTRRDDQGVVWVRLGDGVHEVVATASIAGQAFLTLQFTEPPGHLAVDGDGWSVEGVSPTGAVSEAVQLTRRTAEAATESADESAVGGSSDLVLAQWYEVTRRLDLAVTWESTVRVRRVGDRSRPAVLQVKLLPGESILTQGVRVESGSATIAFSKDQEEASWESSLSIEDRVSLEATKAHGITEVWELSCSPIWRCTPSGIPPVRIVSEGTYQPRWSPWPGERVEIAVEKPLGAPGAAVTIDRAVLAWTPGERLLNGRLNLEIRTSRGGWERIDLPPGSELRSVTVDGVAKVIRPNGTTISLPLDPGNHEYLLEWQLERDLRTSTVMPAVGIEHPIYNPEVLINLPANRWPIHLAAPLRWGPVVLFWIKLAFVVLAAALLSRAGRAPLGITGWILLGLGLATVPLPLAFVPVLWFFILDERAKRAEAGAPSGRFLFNAMQAGIVFLSLLAAGVFMLAISKGLIVHPDMQIGGNGSSSTVARWYSDRLTGGLPEARLFSLPDFAWHLVMLAWSGWVVVALLGWLSWGWKRFTIGGIWR